MSGIIDFHSHILPGIDDGSACLEESLEMLRIMARQGIGHVMATPHFYARHDSPEQFLRRRAEAETSLRRAMENEAGLPAVGVGAEVYFYPGISDSEILQELTLAGTRYILIEMPHAPWPDSMYRELEGIYRKQGLIPVMAHIDRYITPFRTYGIPERLMELPVLVQANASFFNDRMSRGLAMKLLRAEQIHVLGSDAHNLDSRRPNLGEAVERIRKKLGSAILEKIEVFQNAILMDEDVM